MFRTASPRRSHLVLAALAVVAVSLAGCTGQVKVTEYGKEAKANFVGSCTENSRIENDKKVTETLAPKSYCECVYDGINNTTDKHYLPFDDLVAYEGKVASAKAGSVPLPPKQLQASIDACTSVGPQPG